MWCASCLASACAGCTCNLCASAASAVSRRSARLAYCGLFAASLILSFLLRQFAAPLLKHIPWINAFDQTPPEEWFQMNAVLRVNGSVMPASVISVYCTYLCYTSLSSEPDDYECNGLHRHSKQVSMGALILGMLTTVLSVVYSAVRAGSSTTFLSPPSSPRSGAKNPLLGDEEDGKESEPRPVSYSYTFFHLIFALASMYSAMLLTGWTSAASERSELMDVGWTTVWVRICTEWVTAALYIWTLIAPLLFPDRDFS
ncbi:unnamed protein product [Miscanthus lutarioriparius]|uniref:Uncharacterized protein n=1 Tax=Miscanthus lutarioriparius TaxID=422564 RepID=A0A811MJC6_9POAL|nr:unnamed protein product [Miscanthus lutarioriparius]